MVIFAFIFNKNAKLLLMITRTQILFFLLALFIISCNTQVAKKTDERPFRLAGNGDTIYQVLDKQGKLISEETVKKGMKNGSSWTYYPSGKVKEKVLYKDDKKQGVAEWYFEDGRVYQQTPYENGLIDGIKKKFFEGGMLAAEIPYEMGQPFLGTKEYAKDGELIQDTTTLLFYPENDVELEGKFRLRLYLSDKSRDVFFYYYQEVDGEMSKIGIPSAYNGIGDYLITGLPKTVVPQQIRFYAEKNSSRGNPVVLSGIYDFETAIKSGAGVGYHKSGPRRVF